MVASVGLTGREELLDIGTAAGHTALAFAPHVARCVGCDLTEAMVELAAQFAAEQGVQNVSFCVGDAEHLPFEDASFDIVTCRFAAHHFPNIQTAIQEVSRVLKPGGTFLLVDHYAPAHADLDTFVNTLDRMRDPSHVREHRLSEYETWFADASLAYEKKLTWDLPLQFDNWVQRARTPADTQEKLVEYLQTASNDCKETFRVTFDDDSRPVSFCLKCALLRGVKQ
ncbi:methyltransferase domain-containing protein [Alicyclobacillus cycloheptanicus]|nr:methyltransferase domain-containing protein [Alicyclobacillus cycloheptanicus]